MSALDTADCALPLLEFGPRYTQLTDKIKTLREQMHCTVSMAPNFSPFRANEFSPPL
jgi:hypothetical protein